ncbi:MAG: vitamin K epoxide reductase family protein [bacterium]|nr:vitamin K epoxide reductase family protein [bacterium]
MLSRKNIIVAAVLLSAVGLIDAGYLAYSRFSHSELSCSFLDGCNLVAASPYSVLFGIVPLAYLGFLFYALMLVLALVLLSRNTPLVRQTALLFSAAGVLSSAYFTYLQIFVIKAFCVYCLISAALSVLIFSLMLKLYFLHKSSVGTNEVDGDTHEPLIT